MQEFYLNCDPTSAELKVSVGRIFKKRRRNMIISFSIFFLALSMLLFSTNSILNLALGFVCIGFAVVMPLVHIISALVAVRDVENQKFSLCLTEKGINFKTKHSLFVDYESCEAFEDKDVITVLADKSQLYCVPKRCFEDTEKLAEFEDFLTQKLQKRYFKIKQAGV